MTKQKSPDSTRSRGIARETSLTVAENSQQPRAPGWVAPGGANVQSANIEQGGAALRARGTLQGGQGGPDMNSQGSASQAGWGARQSGQRLQARGEEDRLNASRQSGYGGLEQERKTAPQASSAPQNGARQGAVDGQPTADNAGRAGRKASGGKQN